MRSTERRPPAGRLRRRAVGTAGAVALLASLIWLMTVPSTPAQGVMHIAVAAHAPPAEASGPTTAHRSGHSHDHKEGPVAVVVSVIGVIAVVVLIVGLGSLSVRRRTRNGTPTRGPDRGGPPGSGRGPFDHWFRTRE
jgi:4-amino-4-deoxy-L-arabinose transferase-like glycosyltransferase